MCCTGVDVCCTGADVCCTGADVCCTGVTVAGGVYVWTAGGGLLTTARGVEVPVVCVAAELVAL